MNIIRYPFLDLAAVNTPLMDRIEKAVASVVRSGRYIGGKECSRFENTLAAITKVPAAVGVSNGLDALRLILRAYILKGDLKPGDEVIVAANTYVASVLAIVDAGLVPVLAEPSEQTLNLDTARLEEYLTTKTRAVMTVHLYGRVCWDNDLREFVTRHNLIVVEDNAQAIGAESDVAGLYGTYMTGGLGHAGAFSFYPTKNIGALGDAGAVATHDTELAAIVKALANYGADRRYHNIYEGFNCRLDPIQAAILNVKLRYLDKECQAREVIASCYNRLIDNKHVVKPEFVAGRGSVWHQYVLMTAERNRFRAYLESNGVQTDVHYATPPHCQPALAHLAHSPLPITEKIADRVVSIPVARHVSETDAAEIAAIINSFD